MSSAKRGRRHNQPDEDEERKLGLPAPAKFRIASQRLFASVLIALGGTVLILVGYHLWAEGKRAQHEACSRSALQSECAWELNVALPATLSFWVFALWHLCLPFSAFLPSSLTSAARELPYHPTRRTYYVRLVKATAIFYVMLYPAVHQIYFLLILRDATFPARFSAFLFRQVSVMSALFALVFSWTRRQRDSQAAQMYWLVMTGLYALQGTLTSWHTHNTMLWSIYYLAIVPHVALVATTIYGTQLERWEEEEELVWLDSRTIRMGAQDDCEIRLPVFCAEGKRTPARVATLAVHGSDIIMHVTCNGSLLFNAKELREGDECLLHSDESGEPSVGCVGDYYFFAVRRRGQLALRLRRLIPGVPPVQEVDEYFRPFRAMLRGVHPSHSSESVVVEREFSVVQVLRLLGQQLPDLKSWGALALAVIAAMGYSWCEMEALNSQGTILGGAPAAASQADATWQVTKELFFFLLWSVVMYSCQVLNKLASGALRVALGLTIRKNLMPILRYRGEERAAYAIGQQCPTLDERLDNWLRNGLIAVCQLFVGFGFLTRISLPLTGVVLGASCVYALIIVAKLLLIAWISDRRELANSRLVADALTAHRRSRQSGNERSAADMDFIDSVKELYPEYMSIVSWESVLEVIDLFSYTLVLVAALWFGAVLTQDPEQGLSAEEYVAYSLIAQTFAASLSDTCQATTQFTTSWATVVEVVRMLAEVDVAPSGSASPRALLSPLPSSAALLPPSYETLLAEIGRTLDQRLPPPSAEGLPALERLIADHFK